MTTETLSSHPLAIPEETRSTNEWGGVLRLAPDRVAAINDGRTKAIERAIGAEMRFAQGIATVLSTDQLPSALTCTLSPMEGDASMWSRIAAAADLAFGARAMLELFLRKEHQTSTIMTQSITMMPGDRPLDPTKPVVMVEEKGSYLGKTPKKEGVVRFVYHQGGNVVGTVDVAYRYMKSALASRGRKSENPGKPDEQVVTMAKNAKDRVLAKSENLDSLHNDLGISFRLSKDERRQGFDAKYTPYPHCLNYWGSAHGSGLVAFATMGIPEVADGFTIQYHQAAIGEFDTNNVDAQSKKSFYRRRLGNRIQVWSYAPNSPNPTLHLEVALHEPAKKLEQRLQKLDAGTNPFLRSLAGMKVDLTAGDIEATVNHADFGLIATYVDQIFHLVAARDFRMAGPTRSIRVKRTQQAFSLGQPLILRPDPNKWSTFEYDSVKRKRKGVVFFDAIQDAKVVAKIEVECVLGTRAEHAFAQGRVLSEGIKKRTYESVAKVLFGLAARSMRSLPEANRSVTSSGDYQRALIEKETDIGQSYHAMLLRREGANLSQNIHGASTAALAASLVDELQEWRGYEIKYLIPGRPKGKIYHRREGDSIILSQYGKNAWGRPGMRDYAIFSKCEE